HQLGARLRAFEKRINCPFAARIVAYRISSDRRTAATTKCRSRTCGETNALICHGREFPSQNLTVWHLCPNTATESVRVNLDGLAGIEAGEIDRVTAAQKSSSTN